ncbi:MAG: iron-containing alcohol dehydrogenase [Lentisphaeria bacterium]|jgi:alcohol dehydrogenase|nr:iron-containing alcohol dehydrogenase [Lentisphaeria bacterium]MDP7741762.1 iron-containing alcohol dehydrogenase [Lentisphaeria bacterium]
MAIEAFDSPAGTRLVYGCGAIARLGELAREYGSRVLVVSDHGVAEAGHTQHAVDSLEAAGLSVTSFVDVHQNPTTDDVASCLAVARSAGVDLFVGLGGGSAIDTAKGCNFLLTNGGDMHDYQGFSKAGKPLLPLIAVPTTAGTGSECQSFALIAEPNSHRKMACGDRKAMAVIALLDPVLTVTQPALVTACTGIDAVGHAVEAAVTTRHTPISSLHAMEAFRLTSANFTRVLEAPDDLAARGAMLLGAAHAGIAIENSMLGAAHAMANPLTAQFGIVHGQAVGTMLPHVVGYNCADAPTATIYLELAAVAGLASVDALIDLLAGFVEVAPFPSRLTAAGIVADAVPGLAANAAEQWTAAFNPVAIAAADFEDLYRAAI